MITEQGIEKIINDHTYEDSEHRLWLITKSCKNKLISKHSLLYLCKKCYREGYKHGIQIK